MKMLASILALGLAMTPFVHSQSFSSSSRSTDQPSTVDETKFATIAEIRHLVNKICGGGAADGAAKLRLPGTEIHNKVVDFIQVQ